MNVRLVRFSFGPGKGAEARALAAELGPLIKGTVALSDHMPRRGVVPQS